MSQKFLDLAGLTAYDKKVKEWFKAGVVDITEEAINALFIEGPTNNEIWYTSRDGNVVTAFNDVFGTSIVSNEYNDGQGVITFDGPVTSIGSWALSENYYLTSITIPNSVTSIGNSAFFMCSYLASITIPNSVTSIGERAFDGCDSLTSITFEGTMEEWNNVSKGWGWDSRVPATYVQCTDGQVPL